MPNELWFQRQLIEAAKALGGYGQKLSNRFISGVPDLLLQVPKNRTILAEVKQKLITDSTRLVTVNLTKLQYDKLHRHQKSGGYGGWVMVAHLRSGEKWVMASTDLDADTFTIQHYKEQSCHMKRSDPWTKPLLEQVLPILNGRP